MKRKLFGALSVLVLILLFLSGNSVSAYQAFSDVPEDYWAKEEIDFLTKRYIINGYIDEGVFKPEANLTRQQIALMLDRHFYYSYGEVKDQGLVDIKEDNDNYYAISAVVGEGLFDGILMNKKFEPYKKVTRGEMALILAKAFELKLTSNPTINDVSSNHIFYSSIQALIDNNITVLYKGDNFRPDALLTRAQFSAFMARAMHDYFLPIPKQVKGKELLYWSSWHGIMKTAIDTNESVYLHPVDAFGDMYHKDGWIYFMEATFRTDRYGDAVKGYLYRMKEDGSSKEKLSDDVIVSFALQGDKLVYSKIGTYGEIEGYRSVIYDEKMTINSMSLNGSSTKKITDAYRVFSMWSSDNWVYLSTMDGMVRMKNDGTAQKKITNHVIDYYDGSLKVVGDKLYYTTFEGDDWERVFYIVNSEGVVQHKEIKGPNMVDVVDSYIISREYDYENDTSVLIVYDADTLEQVRTIEDVEGYYVTGKNGKLYFYNYITDGLVSYPYN